jgi:nucleotide sugar dehydrogenase
MKELFAEVRERFTPTTKMDDLRGADAFIISVPTLLDLNQKIDLSYVTQACHDLAQCLTKGALVVVESTVPPGTTDETIVKILEKESKLRAGRDFGVAVCPERGNPGVLLQTMVERVRIIGGFDERSLQATAALYSLISEPKPLTVPNMRTAETVKVVENTLRDVEIAYANVIALYCEQTRVDAKKVIEAANTHPARKIRRPSAGVGGACIPVNPHFIIQTSKDSYTNLLTEARRINDYMPQHVADRVSDWVRKEQGKADWKVLLLGYSYKSNVGDVRFTPSKQVLTELVKRDIKVSIYDPHAEPIVSDAEKKLFVDDPYEEARKIHCIVALIDHDIFKSLNFSVLAKKMLKPLFYDCTFSFNAEELRQSGFSYRGVGRL